VYVPLPTFTWFAVPSPHRSENHSFEFFWARNSFVLVASVSAVLVALLALVVVVAAMCSCYCLRWWRCCCRRHCCVVLVFVFAAMVFVRVWFFCPYPVGFFPTPNKCFYDPKRFFPVPFVFSVPQGFFRYPIGFFRKLLLDISMCFQPQWLFFGPKQRFLKHTI
jgi:hypothetical protein